MNINLQIPSLPVPKTASPTSKIGKWLFEPEINASNSSHQHRDESKPWYQVIWLTGVDYFSTLGYQPGIALLAAGFLSPFATIILVLVTLLCALPTYIQVSKQSFAGEGSIAMLENLLKGWGAKLFVLILLGFASTDFIITITLSAADAAIHLAENPLAHHLLGNSQMLITLGLIALLAVVFLRGFHEAIGLASVITIPYIFLNIITLCACLSTIFHQPEILKTWNLSLATHNGWVDIFIVSAFVFPKLALGMSGFETGVSVMPLVKGNIHDKNFARPIGRIKNTQKLLKTAAITMSILLLISSFITTILIPKEAYQAGGSANGRAISYLAHNILGHNFGTLYDISTTLVLWFAGASAMAGLLNLLPRYLPRFGMAPHWIANRRPLVITLFIVAVIVTIFFNANVDAQGSAYATGVLALMFSASIAVALYLWQNNKSNKNYKIKSIYFWAVTLVFAYTFFDNVIVKPDGLIIACTFIVIIVALGAISRYQRALEFRIDEVYLEDEESKIIWDEICNKKVHLVPLANTELGRRDYKANELKRHYKFDGDVAFLNVQLLKNRSEFQAVLKLKIRRDRLGYIMIEAKDATALANTIAYVSELINPISIYMGLTRTNLTIQAFRYFMFGEGETGLMVYRILLKYWEWTTEDDVRPLIFMMSN